MAFIIKQTVFTARYVFIIKTGCVLYKVKNEAAKQLSIEHDRLQKSSIAI
jgi:hypothetical protein